MKYQSLIVLSALVLNVLFVSSCRHEPDIYIENMPDISQICSSDTVYFQNDILSLIVSGCSASGCHNTIDAEEGIVLVDYVSIMLFGGKNLGNPENSDIYEVLSDDDDRMPPPLASEFTSFQKVKILKWIQQGSINNHCLQTECDTLNVSYHQRKMEKRKYSYWL
jgi:hypothetical protein